MTNKEMKTALSSWIALHEFLRKNSLEAIEELLDYEFLNKNRKSYLTRIIVKKNRLKTKEELDAL